MYDYMIIGSGLFGAVIAHELTQRNKTVIVIEKRNHIGGNIYTDAGSGSRNDSRVERAGKNHTRT